MNKLNSAVQRSVFKAGHWDDKINSIEKLCKNHHFNHSVQVILPNTLQLPEYLEENVKDKNLCYFLVEDLFVHEIINKIFVQGFVKNGKFLCLSNGTRIDQDDCMCVTHQGHLVLSLTKDTFMQLGLPSSKNKSNFLKKEGRYVVKIDMTAEDFTPGKKYYDRTVWCLKERLGLKFNVLMKWTPHDDNIYPSSVGAYLQKKGYKVRLCSPESNVERKYSVRVPEISSFEINASGSCCSNDEFYEWLGNFTCSCDLDSSDFANSYQIPEPNSEFGQVILYEMSGFLPFNFSYECIKSVRKFLEERSSIPWAAITIHGFQDSPLSWHDNEHGFDVSGDNLATFVLFNNSRYWMYLILDTHDKIPF